MVNLTVLKGKDKCVFEVMWERDRSRENKR